MESNRQGTGRRGQNNPNQDLVWDVLTVLVWLGMASLVMAVAALVANPTSAINPLPPRTATVPTLVSAISLPTGTDTPGPVTQTEPGTPGKRTPRPTRTATPTRTPITPTATFTATATPTITPTSGPSPTPTIYSVYPFIQRGEINAIAASTFPDHDTCKLWVAGQAYDLQGAPYIGATVMLGGYLNGKNLYQLSLTGTALQYGQAGYEFTVADVPANSTGSVWILLLDQSSIPLSAKIYFDTYDDCARNLILINFRQVR
jgi:hypothetical protein